MLSSERSGCLWKNNFNTHETNVSSKAVNVHLSRERKKVARRVGTCGESEVAPGAIP
jgi:hypothetical protein